MILVPSVPHTGTHFMRDLFKGKQEIHLDHILPSTMDAWRVLFEQGNAAVVPMRHPFLVAESWKRRNKDPLHLPELWHLLVEVIDPYDPQYLCLDKPETRNAQLKAINERLDLNLTTSWPRICEAGISPINVSYDVRLNNIELAATAGLIDDLHQFFERWYHTPVWDGQDPVTGQVPRTRGW